jgi:hypothetical protein
MERKPNGSDSDRSGRGTRLVYDAAIDKTVENKPTESDKRCPWPAKAISATYKYLSQGVRLLGESYATYDDRNIQ